jgi:hypothetical protein
VSQLGGSAGPALILRRTGTGVAARPLGADPMPKGNRVAAHGGPPWRGRMPSSEARVTAAQGHTVDPQALAAFARRHGVDPDAVAVATFQGVANRLFFLGDRLVLRIARAECADELSVEACGRSAQEHATAWRIPGTALDCADRMRAD